MVAKISVVLDPFIGFSEDYLLQHPGPVEVLIG